MTTYDVSHTPARVQRRGLFAGAALLAMAAPVAAASSPPPAPEAHQIALCDHFIRARDALNSTPHLTDDDPRWDSYFAICDEIGGWEPTSLAGLIAKARATKEDAKLLSGGHELEAQSLDWAWDVLNGLIQMGGRA